MDELETQATGQISTLENEVMLLRATLGDMGDKFEIAEKKREERREERAQSKSRFVDPRDIRPGSTGSTEMSDELKYATGESSMGGPSMRGKRKVLRSVKSASFTEEAALTLEAVENRVREMIAEEARATEAATYRFPHSPEDGAMGVEAAAVKAPICMGA